MKDPATLYLLGVFLGIGGSAIGFWNQLTGIRSNLSNFYTHMENYGSQVSEKRKIELYEENTFQLKREIQDLASLSGWCALVFMILALSGSLFL
mgnify:CR=1 FL=1